MQALQMRVKEKDKYRRSKTIRLAIVVLDSMLITLSNSRGLSQWLGLGTIDSTTTRTKSKTKESLEIHKSRDHHYKMATITKPSFYKASPTTQITQTMGVTRSQKTVQSSCALTPNKTYTLDQVLSFIQTWCIKAQVDCPVVKTYIESVRVELSTLDAISNLLTQFKMKERWGGRDSILSRRWRRCQLLFK